MSVLQMRLVLEAADQTRRLPSTATGAQLIAPPTRTTWDSLNARLDAPGGLHVTAFQ